MARTRKSILGENPFATGHDASAGQASDEAKPPEKKAKGRKSHAVARPKGKAGKAKAAVEEKKSTKPKPTKLTSKPAATRKPAKASKPATKSAAPTEVNREADEAKSKQGKDQVRRPRAQSTTVAVEGKTNEDSFDVPAERLAEQQATKRRIAAEIRELESRVLDQGEEARDPDASIPLGLELPGGEDGGMFDAARELLSSDYYLRQWGRLGMRNRSAEVDDFGHDLKYDARFKPLLDLLYERYFRVDTDGIEHVPAEGRALIVANHAGTFPYDGIMLKTALRREHPHARSVRWLAEDHLFYMPFVGSFLNRMGAVRACQENAERLLRQERLVAVFPEGAKGTGRLYRNRHKLQRFGRGGFVRLCLRTQTPVIPCVIVGAEESMPLLFRIEYLANLLGIPYIPITPTFPALGPLGVIPAPTKWQFTFGEPIHFERYGEEAAEDHVLVRRLTERVRATMQGMLDQANASRRSLWFG